MKRTIRPFTPVVVHWEDAEAQATRQHDTVDSALRSYKPAIRKSIGFFVGVARRNGRSAVLLATDDDRVDGSEDLGGMTFIPTGLVLKVDVLRGRRR